MESDIIALNEIVIFPDSSLKALLSKAFNKITDNYPKNSIELTGLYRSYHKSVSDNRYLDFTEASLRMQQGGYQNSGEDAQVEVLKVRNVRFPNRDSVDKVRYYGGAFVVNWNDPVKMREPFLNPKFFNRRFHYHLLAVTRYNSNMDSVYIVYFKSVDKNKEGTIWIDKKNLSYLKVEWKDNDPVKANPFSPIDRKSRNYLTVYQRYGIVSLLKYTSVHGINYNLKTNRSSKYALEFSTISFSDINSENFIPMNRRLKFQDLLTEESNSKDTTFSIEYDKIKMDSIIISDRLKPLDVNNITSTEINFERANSHLEFRDIIHNISKEIKIWYSTNAIFGRSIGTNQYMLNFPDRINGMTKEISRSLIGLNGRLSISFNLNPSFEIRYTSINNLFKNNLYHDECIEVYHHRLVKKVGNPLFITTSLGFSSGHRGVFLEKLYIDQNKYLNDLDFTKDVFAYFGNKNMTGIISCGVGYQKKRFLYFFELHHSQLFRKENVFLFRTARNLFNKTNTINYPLGNISITPEGLHFKYFPVTVSAGIRLGL